MAQQVAEGVSVEQVVDLAGPFVRPRVGEKLADFLRSGGQAGGIERGAAQELGVAAEFRRQHFQRLQFRPNLRVDEVLHGGLGPGKVGPMLDHDKPAEGHLSQEADQHGRLPFALARHEPVGTNLHHPFGGKLEDGQAGDVADGPVRKVRVDDELLRKTRLLHQAGVRQDFNVVQT